MVFGTQKCVCNGMGFVVKGKRSVMFACMSCNLMLVASGGGTTLMVLLLEFDNNYKFNIYDFAKRLLDGGERDDQQA